MVKFDSIFFEEIAGDDIYQVESFCQTYHLGEIRRVVEDNCRYRFFPQQVSITRDEMKGIVNLIDYVDGNTSTTSLKRRDAEMKAEALERFSRTITEEWIENGENYGLRVASGQALLQATEYRRQAQALGVD